MSRLTARTASACLLAAACVLALGVSGCCSSAADGVRAPMPEPPPAPDLSTPESSVRAYLDWTSYAHRMANSEVASDAMTVWWGVHVDSYIEKMRQEENKGIDQRLERLDVRSSSVEDTGAVVTASEDWTYRYFSLADQTYLTERHSITYDTTYTLTLEGGRWLVSDVKAEARGELK